MKPGLYYRYWLVSQIIRCVVDNPCNIFFNDRLLDNCAEPDCKICNISLTYRFFANLDDLEETYRLNIRPFNSKLDI